MSNSKIEGVKMLASLIEDAGKGKKIEINATPIREIVRMRKGDQDVDSVILTMVFIGTDDGEPFNFKKNYSFVEDDAQYALECLLVANNRLQIDYDRLRVAGISVKEIFFTFENSFMGLPSGLSTRRPILRLQDFIHLARAGASVSVDINPQRRNIVLRTDGAEKKGFACVASFNFKTGEEETVVDKLYSVGSFDDSKEYQTETKNIANKRLERDCNRLRNAGMQVSAVSF